MALHLERNTRKDSDKTFGADEDAGVGDIAAIILEIDDQPQARSHNASKGIDNRANAKVLRIPPTLAVIFFMAGIGRLSRYPAGRENLDTLDNGANDIFW